MKKEELKKEFETGTVLIDKDNIHLYYEFMSDEDLEKIFKNSSFLHDIQLDRFFKIAELLRINTKEFEKFKKSFLSDAYFGIKDVLKPIDEYIAEIKASSEYKEYIAESKESNIEFLEYIVKSTSFTKVNFTTTKVIFDKYTDEIKNNYQRINTILKELIDGFNSFEFVAENGNLVFNYQWDENFSGNGFIKISEIEEAYKEYISTK